MLHFFGNPTLVLLINILNTLLPNIWLYFNLLYTIMKWCVVNVVIAGTSFYFLIYFIPCWQINSLNVETFAEYTGKLHRAVAGRSPKPNLVSKTNLRSSKMFCLVLPVKISFHYWNHSHLLQMGRHYVYGNYVF